MDPESIATAVQSGEPDQVNDAIEDIKDLDVDERVELFDGVFEAITDIYAESNDGYVRQSTVRVAEQFVPGFATVFLIEENPEMKERIAAQVDTLCGFLLRTMEDDDGRVRNSAKLALDDIYRSYDALGDEETIEALCDELGAMAETATKKRRKHLLETRRDAEHLLQSPTERLFDKLRQVGERSRER